MLVVRRCPTRSRRRRPDAEPGLRGPQTMLRAWQFPLENFLETLKRHDKTKPDPAKVEEYLGYITKQWDERFSLGRDSEYVTYNGGGGLGG